LDGGQERARVGKAPGRPPGEDAPGVREPARPSSMPRAILRGGRLFGRHGRSGAARSGVAKTTIYRSPARRSWSSYCCRWPRRSLHRLGSDPLQALRPSCVCCRCRGTLPGRMLMALPGEAQNDPDVRDALLRDHSPPPTTGEVIRKAQEQAPSAPASLRRCGPSVPLSTTRQEPATEEFRSRPSSWF
jgi:hypothetical protein